MHAIVGHHFWGRPGGGQLVVAAAAHALSQNRDVTLSATAKFNQSNYLDWFGIDLRKFPLASMPFRLNMLGLYTRLFVWYPTEKALKPNTDVVFLDESNYKPLLRTKRKANFKIVEYVHFPVEISAGLDRESDANVTERYSHFPLNIYWEIYRKLLRLVVRKNPFEDADIVLTNSKWTARVVGETYHESPVVLNPPIPPNAMPTLFIPSFDMRENYVVMVGRFTEEKRYKWVIENIAPKIKNFSKLFLFGGAGTPVSARYKNRLMSVAVKNGLKVSNETTDSADVYFISDAPRSLINSTMDKAKVFLHSTINEHWGISVCFPPDTLVSTGSSLLPIQEIKVNQTLQTHLGVEGVTTRTFEHHYSGELISVFPNGLTIPFSLTPEHPVFCIKRKSRRFVDCIRKLQPEWVPANEIKKGDILCYPINREINQIGSFDITKHLNTRRKSEVGFSFDKNVVWCGHDNKSFSKIPRYLNLDSDTLWLVGFCTAEGLSYRDFERSGFSLEPESKEKAIIILDRIFGIPSDISSQKKLRNISQIHRDDLRLPYRLLGTLFRNLCGTDARKKHFPHFLMNIDPKRQLEMLHGFWDGSARESRTKLTGIKYSHYHTKSRVLVHQIKEIFLRNGKIPSITRSKTNDFYTIVVTPATERRPLKTRSFIEGSYFYVPVNKVERSDYEGKVYNLEIEGANSYTLESGTVHNCEGLVRGLPIVVHKSGGAWSDLAQEGKSGLGYTEAQEAVDWIASLCDDGKKWTSYQREGITKVKELTLQNFSQRLNQLVESSS